MSNFSVAIKRQSSILPEWIQGDKYWRSTLMILQAMVKREPKSLSLTQKFVNLDESTIDFFAMKRAVSSWSHSEKIMIALAAHLFNERNKFNLSDLDYLDSHNLQVALKAIYSRYGGDKDGF